MSLGGTALAGGRFSLAGSVVGAVIIGTLYETIQLTHIAGHQIPNEWFQVAEAVVILGVCLLQSEQFRGLVLRPFGGEEVETTDCTDFTEADGGPMASLYLCEICEICG